MASQLESAYHAAEKIALEHYENFPVGSIFLPKTLRKPICVIYAFARSADDIADEGDDTATVRLEKLECYWQALEAMEKDSLAKDRSNTIMFNTSSYTSPPLFFALQDVINSHKLPYSLFFDLLKAFKQDVIKQDYQSYDEILQYCNYSANPIGRLLLHLTNNVTEENLSASDSICTALQLINFIQDLHSDLTLRNRCYFPLNEMLKLGIHKNDLLSQKNSNSISFFINDQIVRAKKSLEQGTILVARIRGLFGFELRLIIAAAHHIIETLLKRTIVYERPSIRFWHWPKIFLLAVFSYKNH